MTTELLSAVRLKGIVDGLMNSHLKQPQPLFWNDRIPDVPAADGEIMARFIGTPIIADLVANDAKTPVREYGKIQYETTKIPNIKVGYGLTEDMLSQLDALQGNLNGVPGAEIFTQWENRTMQAVLYGVSCRKEALKVAMLTDGFNYNALGIEMANVSWGMPSDLRVTTSTTWDNTGATPITDINTVRDIAAQRYGISLNRLTMSSAALRYLVKTTEFINQSKLISIPTLLGAPNQIIPLQDQDVVKRLAASVLNVGGEALTIELDDRRYFTQESTGVIRSQRFHPIGQVILTDSRNDGNAAVWDFANGRVMESVVANLANVPGQKIPQGFGPIAYATLADPSLNPPGIVYWGVARGFPRKHMLQSSACLTVGNFSDPVSSNPPF